jgi:D-alanyl-lipoteichoic acid acyltransferase DltB (MBOAT superfamily)
MMVSVPMIVSADPFWRGVGIQFLVWGGVDAAIAVFGARMSAKKQAGIRESERAGSEVKEARWLERVLWINTCLDVLYVLGGVWLTQTLGVESPLWRGHGVGVAIQGGFLFCFDFYHARVLQRRRD